MNHSDTNFKVDSIDIFITTRCGLRCKHCFVGDDLNLNLDFNYDLFLKLLKSSLNWNAKEITLLGGEPTLYPFIKEAITEIHKVGLKSRLVTNGHLSFGKFIKVFQESELPRVTFSLDGSNEQIHDKIRGKSSFKFLMQNIKTAKELGYKISGIISVSKENSQDIEGILDLSQLLGFEYLNIHYVSNRGFANKNIVLSLKEWDEVIKKVEYFKKSSNLRIRLEKTFSRYDKTPIKCAIKEKSNLMFYPDGRVYMCMMFIDQPNSHSFNWSSEGLLANNFETNETSIVNSATNYSCPAMSKVNSEIQDQATTNKCRINCIYDKTEI